MHTPTDYIKELEALWHNDFPLNRSMRLAVDEYKRGRLSTRAPLAGNTNTHGTAFAGSLYALQALTAWSLIWLELKQHDQDAAIIHARGDINFHAPLEQDICITCEWADCSNQLALLQDQGRIRFDLETRVLSDDEVCATFSGAYVVRKP